jgi:hypothetical protein
MKRMQGAVLSVGIIVSVFLTAAAAARDNGATPRVLKFSASLYADCSAHFEPGVVGVTDF